MSLVHALGGRTFASLRRHRNYRLYFVGQIVSISGTWMQNIAMYWLVLSLTHSPLAVGVLSIARFGPFTLFALFAGVIVDRIDNRKTVMVTQATQMVLAAALTVLALTGVVQPWHVMVIAFLGGTVLVLDAPARQGADVPDGRPRRAAERDRAQLDALQPRPRRRPRDRRRDDRRRRHRLVLRRQRRRATSPCLRASR